MKKFFWPVVAIFVFILLVCAFNYKWIYYHFYPFDRIKGEYEICINGKEVNDIDEYYNYQNRGKIRLQSDTETFKIKGGKYGRYEIGFLVSEDELYKLTNDENFRDYGDLDLSVVYENKKWWGISEFDIEIDLVEDDGEWYVCYDIELEEPLENFEIKTLKVSEKIRIDDVNNTEILIGI